MLWIFAGLFTWPICWLEILRHTLVLPLPQFWTSLNVIRQFWTSFNVIQQSHISLHNISLQGIFRMIHTYVSGFEKRGNLAHFPKFQL